jgi:hypothetical protein
LRLIDTALEDAVVAETETKRSPILYAFSGWMVVNVLLIVTLILNGDVRDLNNWIEIALWCISIPVLLSMKKWGVAFALIVLVYTLSTSVGILIYYQIWLNAIRVAVNIPIIVYLFNATFKGKFK